MIERLRMAAQPKLSARAAAKLANLSPSRWTQIVRGYKQETPDVRVPVRAPADTLARMAKAVGATPEQLREVGRKDAADELEGLTITVREARDSGRVGLGRGLEKLIPTEQTPEMRAQMAEAVESLRAIVEDSWRAVTELTDAVLRSGPSAELLDKTRRIVWLISGHLTTRILGSGQAPELEDWLERIYVERGNLVAMLSPNEERIRWEQSCDRPHATAGALSDDTEPGSAAGIEAAIAGVRAELEVEDGYQRGEKPS